MFPPQGRGPRANLTPGTALTNLATRAVISTPPEGEALRRDLLANWERYLHDATAVDPLVRMAVGHYQFEAIHPFTDGNGRTGRIRTCSTSWTSSCSRFRSCT